MTKPEISVQEAEADYLQKLRYQLNDGFFANWQQVVDAAAAVFANFGVDFTAETIAGDAPGQSLTRVHQEFHELHRVARLLDEASRMDDRAAASREGVTYVDRALGEFDHHLTRLRAEAEAFDDAGLGQDTAAQLREALEWLVQQTAGFGDWTTESRSYVQEAMNGPLVRRRVVIAEERNRVHEPAPAAGRAESSRAERSTGASRGRESDRRRPDRGSEHEKQTAKVSDRYRKLARDESDRRREVDQEQARSRGLAAKAQAAEVPGDKSRAKADEKRSKGKAPSESAPKQAEKQADRKGKSKVADPRLAYRQMTFDGIMADPAAREDFTRFLVSTFCAETMAFIQAVDAVRAGRGRFDNADLYRLYLDPDGPHTVNITGVERDQVLSENPAVAAAALDNAYGQVVQMLKNDPYVKYKMSVPEAVGKAVPGPVVLPGWESAGSASGSGSGRGEGSGSSAGPSTAAKAEDPRMRFRRMTLDDVLNDDKAMYDFCDYADSVGRLHLVDFHRSVKVFRSGGIRFGGVYRSYIGDDADNPMPELDGSERQQLVERYTREGAGALDADKGAFDDVDAKVRQLLDEVFKGYQSSDPEQVGTFGRRADANIPAPQELTEVSEAATGPLLGSVRVLIPMPGDTVRKVGSVTEMLTRFRKAGLHQISEQVLRQVKGRRSSGDRTPVVVSGLAIAYEPTDLADAPDFWSVGIDTASEITSSWQLPERGQTVVYTQFRNVVVVNPADRDIAAALIRLGAVCDGAQDGKGTIQRQAKKGLLARGDTFTVTRLHPQQDEGAFKAQLRALHKNANVVWS